MADQLQLRGGTTAEHSTFTGALREVTVDTDKDTVVVHDGSTAGGHPLAKQNLSNVPAGTITSTMIADGTIVNADVNASAAIAGTKISPDFGSQNVTTTGTSTAASFIPSSSTAPTNGVYLPSANNVAISTNGTGRLFVDSNGRVAINPSASDASDRRLLIRGVGSGDGAILLKSSSTPDGTSRGFLLQSFGASSDAYVWQLENSPLILGTNSTERLRITSTGELKHIGGGSVGSPAVYFAGSAPSNSLYVQATTGQVGIGTSSPGATLHVNGGSASRTGYFVSTDTSAYSPTSYSQYHRLYLQGGSATNAYNGIGFTNGSNSEAFIGFVQNASGYGDFVIQSYAGSYGEKLRVTSAGNVGIGTTSPGYNLSIFNNSNNFVQFSATGDAVAGSLIGRASSTELRVQNSENAATTFWTNNTERVRIDSSGTFRIKGAGTAGVNDAVQLNGSAPANSLLLDASGRVLVGTSSTATGGDSQYARLQVKGNTFSDSGFGIISILSGTTTPANDVTVGALLFAGTTGNEFARIDCVADAATGSGDFPSRLVFSTTADGASSPTPRMTIDNTGSVLINTLTKGGSEQFSLIGSPGFNMAHASTGTIGVFRTGGIAGSVVGSIAVTASATAYNTSSDYRLKENVVAVTDGITRLQQLKPSRFNFIVDPDKTVDGFIAHEVQAVVPEAITGEKDAVDDEGNPEYQGIDQSKLVPLLTAALQEAIGRIETLEAEVAALKAK